MSKHTPGPWQREHLTVLAPCEGARLVVAEVSGPHRLLKGRERNEDLQWCIANARLIAAAPELLAELQNALQALQAHGFTQQAGKARAAIAKATGEEK